MVEKEPPKVQSPDTAKDGSLKTETAPEWEQDSDDGHGIGSWLKGTLRSVGAKTTASFRTGVRFVGLLLVLYGAYLFFAPALDTTFLTIEGQRAYTQQQAASSLGFVAVGAVIAWFV